MITSCARARISGTPPAFRSQIGNQGIHVELASLQAVLAGGVAFDAPSDSAAPPAPANTVFTLYQNYNDAKAPATRPGRTS